ncbi:MAG TPA: response regulator [Lacunisphaera sp.]
MPRILVIDDDDLIRNLVHRALTKAGYEVTVAPNGRKGLAAFQAAPADLVVTDIIMPDMEGLEVIIEFKRRAPGLKIVAMSGGGAAWNSDYLQMAEKLGASRILHKPFSPSDLCALAGELLGGPAPTLQPT